jgi:hypothetical protein
MNNSEFLDVLKKSFLTYVKTSARSNEKLKILHGDISKDLSARIARLNGADDSYALFSLGYKDGKESVINGRYIDKSADITIKKDGKPIAGIAVKYVMSNYKQNANNYFENMLGETANIRCERIPYFQIVVIPEKLPYYDKYGNITKWEEVKKENLRKYVVLSDDDACAYMHTPDITLLCVVTTHNDEVLRARNKEDYKNCYLKNSAAVNFAYSSHRCALSPGVVYNDYEAFITKVAHRVLSL